MQPRCSTLRHAHESLRWDSCPMHAHPDQLSRKLRRSSMLDRRNLIKHAGAGVVALGSGVALGALEALAADTVTMPFENGVRPLVKYPQKRPMIGLTSRPPQLETPFSVFNEGAITP